MIFCPSCNTECPDNANFCLNCGSPLKSIAQKQIQHQIDPATSNDTMTKTLKRLMPTSYVEKLLSSKGKMEGERRVVTILFSDVKGSTSLAENLDPEEVLEIMNGAFNVLIEPITRYEGTIARLMGDAILAFFGAPIAHEDDPYRACKAALDIIEGAKAFSKKLEVERDIKGFGVRVGINTGLVVVAEVGTDLRVEYTAMGDAVNVAARMESAAEPGTILITEVTKKLVQGDFELMSIGPIQVKGKSSPINTFRVLGTKKQSVRFTDTIRYNSPLIGRDFELGKMKGALEDLKSGCGKIISITGDGGIGKSRLVAEAYTQKPQGLKWAEGKALSYTSNKSYCVALDLMKNYFGFFQDSTNQRMLDSIQEKVEDIFGERSDDVFPYIKFFLKGSGSTKEQMETNYEDLLAVKGQFHFAFKEFIKKESLEKPVVLVWEDLQWCDSSSLELLNELLSLVIEMPVLFLLQYRLDENEKRAWDFHKNVLKKYPDNHTDIVLHSLMENECNLLTDSLTSNIKLPFELKYQVVKKSEGNPSFIEELLCSISEQNDSIKQKDSSDTMNLKNELKIPDSLHNVIMSRVDNLEWIDKITIQTAAVIGRVFPKKLLARVLSDRLNESELEGSLKELQYKEFILRHLPANISSNAVVFRKEFIFKQDLTQNVLYDSLLLSQRQDLHKKIGFEIENLYSENLAEFAESLALHFEKGKDFVKALFYNKLAAEGAKSLFANDDAILFYSKALELCSNVQTEPIVFAQIHESMGDVYLVTAQYIKSSDHYNSALKYNNDLEWQSDIYYKLGKVFERRGNYEMSLEKYYNALKLISQNNDNELLARINSGISMVYYRQGNLNEAEKLITTAFNFLSNVKGSKTLADVYNIMGIIYSRMGEFDRALGFHNECLQIRERSGLSTGLAATYNNIGYIYQQKNKLEDSINYYKKSLEYCEKTGNLHGLAKTFDNLSQIYLAQGKNEEAMNYSLKAVSLLGKIANEDSQTNANVWLQSGVW